MSYAIATVFGPAISVNSAWRVNQVQFNGYAGAAGVSGMYLGTRGRSIIVSGTMYYTAATYLQARYGLISAIDAIIATYTGIAEDTWTYGSYESYANTVLVELKPLPAVAEDGTIKTYHWNGAQCYCKFNAYLRQMI